MKWKVVYKESVSKDLKKISPPEKLLIKQAIEEKLMEDPIKFGLPLRRSLKNYKKLRVGNYRVIYSIEKSLVTVFVIKIGHRKNVYNIT